MKPKGLFLGITTVDLHYHLPTFMEENLKSKADHFALSTGGPATNAAAAFAALGGRSALCTAVGQHPFTPFIHADLLAYGIDLLDCAPNASKLPPFSSIITTKSAGERTVITYTDGLAAADNSALPQITPADFDILLLDGFHLPLGQLAAVQARHSGVPVVLDGGSWKEGMAALLPYVDIAICSADFRPPGIQVNSQPKEILDYLAARGVSHAAITRGAKPILYLDGGSAAEIPVAPVKVVDTLGAGDIFHGAFSYYYAQQNNFPAALSAAARIASQSCQHFGARTWMNAPL